VAGLRCHTWQELRRTSKLTVAISARSPTGCSARSATPRTWFRRHFVEPGTTSALVELDGESGVAVHGPECSPIAVFGFCVDESGLITATHVVVNPRELTRVPSAVA